MKAKKHRSSKTAVEVAAPSFQWGWAAAAAAAFCAVFWAYGPALHGPFVFDDTNPPYALPAFNPSLRAWVGGGMRGLLLFSYWVNAQIGHDDPYSFHVVGVLIHIV